MLEWLTLDRYGSKPESIFVIREMLAIERVEMDEAVPGHVFICPIEPMHSYYLFFVRRFEYPIVTFNEDLVRLAFECAVPTMIRNWYGDAPLLRHALDHEPYSAALQMVVDRPRN